MNDDIQDRLNNTVALLKRANSQLHDRGEGSELGDAIVDVLDECRQYIERLRGIVATFVEGDGSGYFPFVAKDFNGIAEVLVQIFRDDDGLMLASWRTGMIIGQRGRPRHLRKWRDAARNLCGLFNASL